MTSLDTTFDFPSHAETALKVMDSYFRNQQITDVILIAGDKRIAAHRLVLSASSDYFAAMFTSSMKESGENEVLLMEIDGDALSALVQFCYTGSIKLQEDNVQTLLVTARRLQFNPIVEACIQLLIKRLDSSNCLGMRKLGDTQGCDDLTSRANTYVLENFVEVSNNQEFLSLSSDEVAELLKSDDVIVPSEETIFNALMTWLKHDIDIRKKHASMLLSYVRLPLLPPRFITDHIRKNEFFRDQKAVQDSILEAYEYHLLPERTQLLLRTDRTKPQKSTSDVLLSLGYTQSAGPFAIVGFLPSDNVWKTMAYTNDGTLYSSAVFFANELYLTKQVASGTSVTSLDFSSGLWKDRPPLQQSRSNAGFAVLGGFLYAMGGSGGFGSQTAFNTVERWEPIIGKWSYVSSMLTAQSYAGVAVVNNKLYVVGGYDVGKVLNVVECYDPCTNKWTRCSPMFEARCEVRLGVLNGCIYVAGGFGGRKRLNSAERYDPKTDTWTMIAPMSVARSNAGVGVSGNQLFVVGGIDDNLKLLTVVEAYDPAFNKWQEVAPLEAGRAGPCVVVNRSLCKFQVEMKI